FSNNPSSFATTRGAWSGLTNHSSKTVNLSWAAAGLARMRLAAKAKAVLQIIRISVFRVKARGSLFLRPGRQVWRERVDDMAQQQREGREDGHGGEDHVGRHAGIGLHHDEAEPSRRADPFADHCTKGCQRRGDAQAGHERR